jgi:hypothetical protein
MRNDVNDSFMSIGANGIITATPFVWQMDVFERDSLYLTGLCTVLHEPGK